MQDRVTYREAMLRFALLCVIVLLTGCSQPYSLAYREMYAHLDRPTVREGPMVPTEYFLVILVDAHHLDYTDCRSFVNTVAKHPGDCSKAGDVGHAWIYLQGVVDGVPICIEGGFSGERGIIQAQYFDGIMNYIDYGYANPTCEQMWNPRYEPNPAKYLWETQCDGFFQWGPGRHRPTYAAKIDLSQEQFCAVANFIMEYDYVHYAITGNQCSSYITQIGEILGLDLEATVYLPIDSSISFGGECMRLWTDPQYAWLPISTPDLLEKKLMDLVDAGSAQPALAWYQRTHPVSFCKRLRNAGYTLSKFPCRISKFLYMKGCH